MIAVERVAGVAAQIRPLRVMLSILAAPFYVVGALAGLFVMAVLWAAAAVQVGYSDARRRDGESS